MSLPTDLASLYKLTAALTPATAAWAAAKAVIGSIIFLPTQGKLLFCCTHLLSKSIARIDSKQ
jgi:hypothetical protein